MLMSPFKIVFPLSSVIRSRNTCVHYDFVETKCEMVA
jgi:hypothetical protein